MSNLELFDKITQRPDVANRILIAKDEEEIREILANNGLKLTPEQTHTILMELGNSVSEIITDQDELLEDDLDGVAGGGMITIAIGTTVIKASGTLAIALGGATGVALGVGAVCVGVWAYKKYIKPKLR